MIKIGLVGEDPNDTEAFKNLFKRKYTNKFAYKSLLNGINGFQLDNPKCKRSFEAIVSHTDCKYFVFIRDLDGFRSEKRKVTKVKKWYDELNTICKGKGILLMNIWELEALVLADIEAFNLQYKINPKEKIINDVEFIKEPKERLKKISQKGNKRYTENHISDIFNHLDFNKLISKCAYFKNFVAEFDKKMI